MQDRHFRALRAVLTQGDVKSRGESIVPTGLSAVMSFVPVPVPVRVADGGTEGVGVVALLLIMGEGSGVDFPDDVDDPHPTTSRQQAGRASRMMISLVHA